MSKEKKKWTITKKKKKVKDICFKKAQFSLNPFNCACFFLVRIFCKTDCTAFFPHPSVGFQRSDGIHWSNESWMIYLEKDWENSEQITRWMVKPNALFSPRPVFTVSSISWAYHGQKNRLQLITLPSALKEHKKSQLSSKFVLGLRFAVCFW